MSEPPHAPPHASHGCGKGLGQNNPAKHRHSRLCAPSACYPHTRQGLPLQLHSFLWNWLVGLARLKLVFWMNRTSLVSPFGPIRLSHHVRLGELVCSGPSGLDHRLMSAYYMGIQCIWVRPVHGSNWIQNAILTS